MFSNAEGRLLPLLAVIAAVVFWGSSFAVMKYALGYYPPAVVVGARMVIAFTLVLPLLGRMKKPVMRRGDWKLLLLLALFEPILYFLLEINALRFTTSSQAGMVAALVPLLVVIGARLSLGERMSAFAFAGVLISVAGVILLTLSGEPQQSATNPVLGNVLEFAAMCCAAGYTLTLKHLSERYHALHLTAAQFFIGSVFFLPGFYLFPVEHIEAWSLQPILALIYLGVFVTFGAFVMFNYSISKLPAGQVTVFINFIPVIALLLGWGVMAETVSPLQWLAAALVMGGVMMSQQRGAVVKTTPLIAEVEEGGHA